MGREKMTKWCLVPVSGILGLAILVMTGCGANLVSGGSSSPGSAIEQAKAALDNAKTPAQFTQAVDLASQVLSNPSATDLQKQTAYTTIATAICGAQGITMLSVATQITELASASSADQGLKSFTSFDSLVSGVDISKLKTAVANIKSAKLLQPSSTRAIRAKDGIALTADENQTFGLINLVTAYGIFNAAFTVGEDGSVVSTLTGSDAAINSIKMVMDRAGNGDGTYSVPTLISDALAYFDAAEALTNDQKRMVTKLASILNDSTKIYNALLSSTPVVITFSTGSATAILSASSTNAQIYAALEKMIQQ
jgi:ethanolamine utilization protein EutP (predicted NTPase)